MKTYFPQIIAALVILGAVYLGAHVALTGRAQACLSPLTVLEK